MTATPNPYAPKRTALGVTVGREGDVPLDSVKIMRGRGRHLLKEQRQYLTSLHVDHAIDLLEGTVDFKESLLGNPQPPLLKERG
jgi:hypothetical protein